MNLLHLYNTQLFTSYKNAFFKLNFRICKLDIENKVKFIIELNLLIYSFAYNEPCVHEPYYYDYKQKYF